jgi:hypothetical protein
MVMFGRRWQGASLNLDRVGLKALGANPYFVRISPASIGPKA